MAAVFLASAGTGNSASVTSRTITRPAAANTADDVGVFFLERWQSDNPAVTAPAGTVHRGQVLHGVGQAKVDTYLVRLTASPPASWTFSWSTGQWTTLQAMFFRGIDPALDLAAVPFHSWSGTAGTFGTTTVTTVLDAALCWSSYNDTSSAHTPPTNFIEAQDADCGSTAYRISPADGSQSAVGGSVTSSSNSIAVLLALAPATTGPNTGTATGTALFTTSAAGQRPAAGSTSATASFAASAVGAAPAVGVNSGTAAGTANWAGVANGTAPAVGVNSGTAAGTANWAGVAVGGAVHTGAVTGTSVWAGSANGTAPTVGGASGAATGTWSASTAAAGSRPSTGAGTSTAVWAGAAAGTSPPTGLEQDIDVTLGHPRTLWHAHSRPFAWSVDAPHTTWAADAPYLQEN